MVHLETSSLETALKVVDEVSSLLNTNTDTDEVVADTNLDPVLESYGAVGHLGRKLDQTLNTTERLGKGEDVEIGKNLVGRCVVGRVSLDAERDHTAVCESAVRAGGASGSSTLGDLSSCNLVAGVRWKTGVDDSLNGRVGLEELSDSQGRLAVSLHAERKGLETTESEPAVERRRDGTDAVLQESETVSPGLVVGDSNTHDNITVAVEVLGDTVHDKVSTVSDGILEPGAHEGVVDNNLDVLAGVGVVADELDDERNVDNTESRVGRGLDPDERRLLAKSSVDTLGDLGFRTVHLDEAGLDALRDSSDLGEVSVGAAIDIVDTEDVRASGHGVEHGGGHSRTRGEGKTTATAFESSDGPLERVAVRVARSGVLVPLVVADAILSEGGAKADRWDNSAGSRVGLGSDVNRLGGEADGGSVRVGVAVGGAVGSRDRHVEDKSLHEAGRAW